MGQRCELLASGFLKPQEIIAPGTLSLFIDNYLDNVKLETEAAVAQLSKLAVCYDGQDRILGYTENDNEIHTKTKDVVPGFDRVRFAHHEAVVQV